MESVEHALVSCECNGCVRFSGLGLKMGELVIRRFDDWLFDIFINNDLKRRDRQLFLSNIALTVWHIWKGRCQAVS